MATAQSQYANRHRRRQHGAIQPRNHAAAKRARDQGVSLVVSFVGDTPYRNPTVFCDSAVRYDWGFVAGLHVLVVVKPGIDARHAMREILEHSDVRRLGYPTLVDLEAREVACIVDGVKTPIQLWQVRRGTELWQQYFEPPA